MADSPLKFHGGKTYLADRIVKLFPDHLHYVEACAGGLSVLFAKKPEGVSEVVNDIDGDLTNFWRVLQDPVEFAALQRRLEATPFSEAEYDAACQSPARFWKETGDGERAWKFFVMCRQSLAGRMKSFSPLSKTRVRRNMNEQASAWLTAIEGLPAVHARLRRVVVLNRGVLDVLKSEDTPKTLFYLDPPYLPSTREAADVYRHEMSTEQHRSLLSALNHVRGMVALSGYRSEMYDKALTAPKWTRHDFSMANHAAGGDDKRIMTECLWTNWRVMQPAGSSKKPV